MTDSKRAFLDDDHTPHRKRTKKASPKKSDHKHEYELIEIVDSFLWFTHKEVCTICGREGNLIVK